MIKKSKLITIIAFLLLLAGCKDAEYFMNLKTIEHVKVKNIEEEREGKIEYTFVTYEKNGKEYETRFETPDDQGLADYYKSAKLFKKEIYLNLVVDKKGYIIVATLSEDNKHSKGVK
ncbi:hypothetical protein [Parageobacillus galactosidasius]|uniref:DUF1093 domain-containing protein n=1 Tax=Parageobacillus galactosidasius TaxID=883812 RepID=A0A226QS29_9BACL|nr:hypothetical protein [Parageobacillus galactosidasius]OXB94708.1 hypothetical protein B9L23_07530 [Parageobacillus galactosidasius]